MTEFKERQLEKHESPELKTSPDTNGDQAPDTMPSRYATSNGGATPDAVPLRNPSSAEQSAAPPSRERPRPDGALATANLNIDAVQDIKQRMDDKKLAPKQSGADIAKEAFSLVDLAKPIVVLLVLLMLPWVVFSGINDWSYPERMRFHRLAEKAINENDYQSGIKYYMAAADSLKTVPGDDARTPVRKAYSIANAANAYYKMNNIIAAQGLYEDAGKMTTDTYWKAIWLGRAALCAQQMDVAGNPLLNHKADALLMMALAAAESNPNEGKMKSKSYVLHDRARILMMQNKCAEALKAVEQSKAANTFRDGPSFENEILTGDIYMAMGERAKALAVYERIAKTGIGDFNATAVPAYLRANAVLAILLGDRASALIYLKDAMDTESKTGISDERMSLPLYTVPQLRTERDTIENTSQ